MTAPRRLLALTLLGFAPLASAVPPLVIGDVPTADAGAVEIYAGAERVREGGVAWTAPATEFVLGVSSWQELTLEVPWSSAGGRQGLGDVVLGTKVLLLPEAEGRPGLSCSLDWKLPSGDAAAGLGNGSTEVGLLLRAQKSWGRLTVLGNAGYTLVGDARIAGVREPRRDTGFLGAGAAVELAARFALVGDAYWASADRPGEPARLAGDLGLTARLTDHLALLGAAGASLRGRSVGGPDARLYLGLKAEFQAF